MTDWRPAYAIDVLLAEVNELWPNRKTASDGIKGDPAHANRQSEHNPNGAGVVTAVDITHDWTGGPNGNELIRYLLEIARAGHPAPWYFVWDHHIYSRSDGWAKQPYTGEDPHTNHIHVSMEQTRSRYDSRKPWNLEDHMPLSDADVERIAEAVWDKRVKNLGTDEPGDTTTTGLIQTRDHERTTDNAVLIKEIHEAVVKP